MRMMLKARMPHDRFNAAIKDGSSGSKMQAILEATKPEAVYFLAEQGQRTAVMIIDMNDTSEIPKFAEPWFLTFGADVELQPVMTPEDLGKAGLDALGKQWG